MEFDADVVEPPHVERLLLVEPDDRCPCRREHLGCRRPGASQPDHEDPPAGQLGCAHWWMNWRKSREKSAKPEAQKIAQTIQKRTMIFVSDQAFISKWWWIGAIRNTRLPVRLKLTTWMISDRTSMTKIPAISGSRISVPVTTAK